MSKPHATHTYRVVWDGGRCDALTSARRAGAWARAAVDDGRRNVRIEVEAIVSKSVRADVAAGFRDPGAEACLAGE